jgi:hypothetical protein
MHGGIGGIHAKQYILEWLIGVGVEMLPIIDVMHSPITPFINTFLSTLPPLLDRFPSVFLYPMQFIFLYLLLPSDYLCAKSLLSYFRFIAFFGLLG